MDSSVSSPDTRRRRAPWVLAALLAVVLAATQLPGLAQSASDDPLPTVVFVARADNPVDALAAGAVGGTMGAQVLLTRTSTLEDTTRQALIDLAPDLVVLAGGTAALSPAVEAAIQAIPLDTRRVSGATRVETAAALSELAAELGFGRPILTGATVAGDAGLAGTMSVGALETLVDYHPPALFAQVTGRNATTTTATAFEDVPDATVTIEIPEDREGYVVARFTAESECWNAAGWCSVQILVDGAPAEPDVGLDFAFDSTDNNTKTGLGWQSHTVERIAGPLSAGTYDVIVQRSVVGAGVNFRLDDWTLTAEVKLTN